MNNHSVTDIHCRPQEKPSPPPAPAVPVPSHPSVAPVTSTLSSSAPELESESPNQTWEEPTTAQPPTWDDEPHVKPPTSTIDVWTSISETIEAVQPEPQSPTQHETDATAKTEPPTPEPAGRLALPASKSEQATQAALTTPISPQVANATPSPKLAGRPTSAVPHRSSARYKTTDQPVVMPSSFGAGIEKVGMQFGSLGLGGDSLLDSNP